MAALPDALRRTGDDIGDATLAFPAPAAAFHPTRGSHPIVTTQTTHRLGSPRRIGFRRSAVVCAARTGDVVRDVRLGALPATTRDDRRAVGYGRSRQRLEQKQFGGEEPRHPIGAEPAAVGRTP